MTIRWAYLKRVLAGAIFGLYVAHLLYFLNPQVDITPVRLATVTIIYGLICGLLFGTVLWLFRIVRVRLFGRPETNGEYRAHGFGYVVLAAFISAALYWMHLYVFRIGYLPIGAVRVLSKALAARYREGCDDLLSAYSATCLERVWRAEHFSYFMTNMLHSSFDDTPFVNRLKMSELRYVAHSDAASRMLAENYVGLPFRD